MNASKIAHVLGGRKSGTSWLMRCVAHDDRAPSLSLMDGENGRLLVHCFAGCDPHDVLAVLRQRGLLAGKDEIYPHPRQERDRIETALQFLHGYGKVKSEQKPVADGIGRPVERWYAITKKTNATK